MLDKIRARIGAVFVMLGLWIAGYTKTKTEEDGSMTFSREEKE